MTVRQMGKTTISVVVLFIVITFFRLNYIGTLSRLMDHVFGKEGYSSVINGKLFPINYIGSYFPRLFYFSVVMVVIACTADAIFNKKTALNVLSSFIRLLFLTGVITIAICIEKINILQLWAIFYICILNGLHSAFKRVVVHSDSVGSYADLKLIKGFVLTIKDTIKKVISIDIRKTTNPVDEITILSVSALLLLLEMVVLISFLFYLNKHWRLIFLSYLI